MKKQSYLLVFPSIIFGFVFVLLVLILERECKSTVPFNSYYCKDTKSNQFLHNKLPTKDAVRFRNSGNNGIVDTHLFLLQQTLSEKIRYWTGTKEERFRTQTKEITSTNWFKTFYIQLQGHHTTSNPFLTVNLLSEPIGKLHKRDFWHKSEE